MPLDYCHSLDAVWEVEEKLIQDGKLDEYTYNLHDTNIKRYPATVSFTGRLSHIRHATALQCCEAIIKVLEGMG
jgi:hypothetical protein